MRLVSALPASASWLTVYMSKEGYMEFKYLSESMSLDEARKAYRSLAKQLHPDIGGDEDEFKILAHEYSVIERRASEPISPISWKLLVLWSGLSPRP